MSSEGQGHDVIFDWKGLFRSVCFRKDKIWQQKLILSPIPHFLVVWPHWHCNLVYNNNLTYFCKQLNYKIQSIHWDSLYSVTAVYWSSNCTYHTNKITKNLNINSYNIMLRLKWNLQQNIPNSSSLTIGDITKLYKDLRHKYKQM